MRAKKTTACRWMPAMMMKAPRHAYACTSWVTTGGQRKVPIGMPIITTATANGWRRLNHGYTELMDTVPKPPRPTPVKEEIAMIPKSFQSYMHYRLGERVEIEWNKYRQEMRIRRRGREAEKRRRQQGIPPSPRKELQCLHDDRRIDGPMGHTPDLRMK